MASSDDLQLLVDFGLLNEDGVSKLANLIRGVQLLSAGGSFAGVQRGPGRRRGRPPTAQGPAMNGGAAGAGKRGPRTKFSATKEQLSSMRQGGMTAKAIAEKLGVSMATVNLHLRKHGLTTPRKGKPAKKK